MPNKGWLAILLLAALAGAAIYSMPTASEAATPYVTLEKFDPVVKDGKVDWAGNLVNHSGRIAKVTLFFDFYAGGFTQPDSTSAGEPITLEPGKTVTLYGRVPYDSDVNMFETRLEAKFYKTSFFTHRLVLIRTETYRSGRYILVGEE